MGLVAPEAGLGANLRWLPSASNFTCDCFPSANTNNQVIGSCYGGFDSAYRDLSSFCRIHTRFSLLQSAANSYPYPSWLEIGQWCPWIPAASCASVKLSRWRTVDLPHGRRVISRACQFSRKNLHLHLLDSKICMASDPCQARR